MRRAALLRLADLYSFFGNWHGAARSLESWLGEPGSDDDSLSEGSRVNGGQLRRTLPSAPNDTQAMNALASIYLELAGRPPPNDADVPGGGGTGADEPRVLSARRLLERLLR